MAWLLLFLHLFLFHFPSSSSSFNFSCHREESSALLQFKSSFTIDNYSDDPCYGSPLKTATWKNGTNCCSWHGVKCDTVSGHVIGLNLGCEGLKGILHHNSTLFHLVHLQTLNLSNNDFYNPSNNDFSNSYFDSKFGGFQSLTHLDLSHSFFEGEIPTQISHLSKLQSLHVSGDYYSKFKLVWKETTLKRLLQNATDLRELFLDNTNMSSVRPNSIALLLNQSSSLVTLNLQSTGLRGKLKKNVLCLPSIQELDMSSNEFQGQLPELSCNTSLRILDLSGCGFKGEIPISFSNLKHLTSLVLSFNNLNGSIPSSLLTLPLLTSLDLRYNKLSGQIPNAFQMSNKFQKLDLSNNKIEGELPTSFSNLQHLIYLDLSSNSFRGQIPSSLFKLTQVVTLMCSHNKLEGPLPNKIAGFQKLTYLYLNDNLLNGTIPSNCLSLPSLVVLYLSNNRLTGPISAISSYSLGTLYLSNNRLQGNIPESIFNLPNLTYLDLSSNNLSGVVHFQLFSKLQKLITLSLSHNSQLSLNFESSFNYSFSMLCYLNLSSLSLTGFHKSLEKIPDLISLDMSNNKLNGKVSNWLLDTGNNLEFLNLSQNLFTSIDQILDNKDQLIGLDLSYNLLDGDLTLLICNMSFLVLLNLAHNNLTGIIPQCLANLSSLQLLDLQMNKLYGTLPSNFSKDSQLQTLNLYGNQLEGHLPKSLSHCKNLQDLNLGNNKIEDKFPDWLQTMQYLNVLVLRDNKLHGPIPNLKIKHSFPRLVILDISGNNFSGPLPKAYFKKFEAMKNVARVQEDGNMSYIKREVVNWGEVSIMADANGDVSYYDSLTVSLKGINRPMVKIPNIFVVIDLSRNKFEGEIPNVIGELHALIGLNLSHNKLTGPIPQSLGNLTNLEWLDFSSNMLTNMIPAELTNLGFLEVLDLSHNHLVGEIPQGKQFDTFSNHSYEGNLGLCGLPLSKKCGPEQHSPPSPDNSWSEEKFGFGWKAVAIGYGCGFVIGIGIGYYMFLIGKPRWLVMIFGGQPKRRVTRRTRMRRNHGSTMNQNQMVQMS